MGDGLSIMNAIIGYCKEFIGTAFAAGVSGAVVGLAWDAKNGEKKPGFLDILLSIISGGIVAQYSEHQLSIWFPESSTFLSFILGMIALFLVGGVINLARSFAKDPFAVLNKFLEVIDRLRGK